MFHFCSTAVCFTLKFGQVMQIVINLKSQVHFGTANELKTVNGASCLSVIKIGLFSVILCEWFWKSMDVICLIKSKTSEVNCIVYMKNSGRWSFFVFFCIWKNTAYYIASRHSFFLVKV